MDMLVVISSEAPKKRKIYHKMGCIYAERIKFQNRLEIKVEQAEKEGYCECKYCAGLRGDVRTHKAQIYLKLTQIIRNLSEENFTDKKM